MGEVTRTTHGIKGNKIMQQPTIKDKYKKELILDGWIIIIGNKKVKI
jgi:hypothetical protein